MNHRTPAVRPTTIPKAPRKRRKPGITAKVRAALEAMVFRGLKRDDAAKEAGMQDNSLYVALRRPEVKAEYLRLCEVLRVSGRARRISRLEEIVEQDENKQAAVNAARALELMGDDPAAREGTQAPVQPGITIVVLPGAQAAVPRPAIDITPRRADALSAIPADESSDGAED